MVECRCGCRFNEDLEDLPHGYSTKDGWICDKCGSCPKCGRSLEKEPEKWGDRNKKAGLCKMCQMWVDEFGSRLFIHRPRRRKGTRKRA